MISMFRATQLMALKLNQLIEQLPEAERFVDINYVHGTMANLFALCIRVHRFKSHSGHSLCQSCKA